MDCEGLQSFSEAEDLAQKQYDIDKEVAEAAHHIDKAGS